MTPQTTVRPIDLFTAVGVVVGKIVSVGAHPNAHSIRIAHVVYAPGAAPAQIVFGGRVDVVRVGCFVPVAPPTKSSRVQGVKMRRRKFRGVVSRGELCSLYELGLSLIDTDEVAILTQPAEIGSPIVDLVKLATTYDDLWKVFNRPLGMSDAELLGLDVALLPTPLPRSTNS